MDALERDWWAKRRLTYNLFLIFAGVTAFAGFVIVGETACTSDPDFEITMLRLRFRPSAMSSQWRSRMFSMVWDQGWSGFSNRKIYPFTGVLPLVLVRHYPSSFRLLCR